MQQSLPRSWPSTLPFRPNENSRAHPCHRQGPTDSINRLSRLGDGKHCHKTGVLAPLTAARQSTVNNIIVSGEAMLSAENSGKPLSGRGSARTPAGGAHSAPPDSLAGGMGLLPLPRYPTPLSAFGSWPPVKNPGHTLDLTSEAKAIANHHVHRLTAIARQRMGWHDECVRSIR